ncbi:TetR/AcrR family transcriptional regulator, partial [Streptococcus anginosus]
MSERKISKKSLENLKISNRESNRITKESLEISLLQLLEKKELTKITISELVERAGVSRAAFYRNYDSKEEILQEIFQRIV